MSAPELQSRSQTVRMLRSRPAAIHPEGLRRIPTERETETGAEAVKPLTPPKALGHLLALLGETDKLVGEVQSVMQRIAVELDHLGISKVSVSDLTDSSWTSPCADLDTLSPREAEIVHLLREGHRVSTIARSLFISQHTVRNHLQSAYRKLDVNSQTELIEKLRGSPRRRPIPPALPRGG